MTNTSRHRNDSLSSTLEQMKSLSTRFSDTAKDEQTKRCATLIRTLIDAGISGSREETNLLRTLIRLSSESSDHRSTVDFVSERVLQSLNKKAKTGKLLKSFLDGSEFRHEHMYPCDAALQNLKGVKGNLAGDLAQMNFRALIDSEHEEKILNKEYKSNLPQHCNCAAPALSRYCATGLLDQLVGVTTRGVTLKNKVIEDSRCATCNVKKRL